MKSFPLLASLLCATILTAAEPIVWRLDRTDVIGGLTPEVLGTPRVVQETSGKALYFNGASDGLFVPVNPLQGLEQFTIQVLFKPEADGAAEQRFLHVQDTPGNRALIEIRLAGGSWALDTYLHTEATKARLPLLDLARRHPADRWTWVALVFDHGHMSSYVDGVKELEGEVAFAPTVAGRVSLGVRQNKVFWFKGGLREVRWDQTALKAAELQRSVP
jgi:hypothetical protein